MTAVGPRATQRSLGRSGTGSAKVSPPAGMLLFTGKPHEPQAAPTPPTIAAHVPTNGVAILDVRSIEAWTWLMHVRVRAAQADVGRRESRKTRA